MRKLTVIGPDMKVRDYEVAASLTIGRSSENLVQILEPKASRQHCRIFIDGHDVVVEDLESSNGTRVNGRKITRCNLKHSDTITIGDTAIVFHDEAAALVAAMNPWDEGPEVEKAGTGRRGDGETGREAEVDRPTLIAASRPVVAEHHSHTNAVLVAALLAGALGLVAFIAMQQAENAKQANRGTREEETASPRLPVPPSPRPSVSDSPSPRLPASPSPRPSAPAFPAAAQAEDDFARAVAERDRALGSGNLLAARAAVQLFAAGHPPARAGTELTQRIKEELRDTEKLIRVALEDCLKRAQKAAAEKKYHLVSRYSTSLLSSDPSGRFGAQARELLTQMDEETKKRYTELRGNAERALQSGQLDKAGEILSASLDELAGTKWAGAISTLQLQLLVSKAFLKEMDEQRAKKSAAGVSVPVQIASRKLSGTLESLFGLSLELTSGGATLPVTLRSASAAELLNLIDALGMSERHTDVACLLLLLGQADAAQAEAEKALQKPDQAAYAASLLPPTHHLRVYDFSNWQQQTDWEALSGSWLTQNQRYVLESGEGGDTSLRTDRIGGPMRAANAHISFDFELSQPREGYFLACEFGGGGGQVLSVIFSAEGFLIQGNIAGEKSGRWPPEPTHVDMTFTEDSLALRLNSKSTRIVRVGNLPELSGTLTFRVREAACAIDNVILRNVER